MLLTCSCSIFQICSRIGWYLDNLGSIRTHVIQFFFGAPTYPHPRYMHMFGSMIFRLSRLVRYVMVKFWRPHTTSPKMVYFREIHVGEIS